MDPTDLANQVIMYDMSNFFCKVKTSAENALNTLNIPFSKFTDYLEIKGTNLIDFMGIIMENPLNAPTLKVWKVADDAVTPCKARESDVGLDLTIISVHKTMRENVIMYDTGIKLGIPTGYYVEVVPRSSLSKTGWMLANSVGIIDASYTGNIYVALIRADPDAEMLPLPFKGFQLILRKQNFVYVQEQDSIESLVHTARGTGGFGSTSS